MGKMNVKVISEAKWYEPNGEYDYFMREQVGFLTPHMGYTGGRCHDE